MTEFRKMVLLSQPRCGTNFFIRAFTSCSDVSILNEPFNLTGPILSPRTHLADEERTLASLISEKVTPTQKLSLLLDQKSYTEKCSGVILKIFPEHDQHLIMSFLSEGTMDATILILERRNKLSQYISLLHSKKSKVWRVSNKEQMDGLELVKVHVNLNDFEEFRKRSIEYFNNIEEVCRAKNRTFHKVFYEDISEDHSLISKLSDECGIGTDSPMKIRDIKKLKLTLRDYVENLDEFDNILLKYEDYSP